MSGYSKKYFRSRLAMLNMVIAMLAFAGLFSSCSSKKKLHHHVLHVNDMYLGQDSTSVDDKPDPEYNSPEKEATRYGVRPVD